MLAMSCAVPRRPSGTLPSNLKSAAVKPPPGTAPGAVPGGGFNAGAFDFAGKIPLGRLGRAQDMADMALALLSDRFSGYVTGTTVAVDGGIALYNWIPLPVE